MSLFSIDDGGSEYFGGGKDEHIVVDTLNLTHWLNPDDKKISIDKIIAAISLTSPKLKLKYKGKVMYVLKDKDGEFNTPEIRELYADCAEQNGVYIYLTERYVDEPNTTIRVDKKDHSKYGRDDFFIILLAHRHFCPILSNDNMRDYKNFRTKIKPFQVFEYTYWKKIPNREFVKPESRLYSGLRKRKILKFKSVFMLFA